jgi:hypothetical protein
MFERSAWIRVATVIYKLVISDISVVCHSWQQLVASYTERTRVERYDVH